MKKFTISLFIAVGLHNVHAHAFSFASIKSFNDIKSSLKTFNKIIVQQSQKLLESGCKNLCSAEAIKAEKNITGNTLATCSICAPVCQQLQAKGQISTKQAAAFSQTCKTETKPFTLSLDPMQLANLKTLFGQIGKYIQQDKIKVKSTPKQVETVKISIHDALGIDLTKKQLDKVVQKQNRELEEYFEKDELSDGEIKEMVKALHEAEALLEEVEYDEKINDLADKLKNYLANIAEQEKITPQALQKVKKNLKRSYVPTRPPKNIVDQGKKSLNTIMKGIHADLITFKIGKYSKKTKKPIFSKIKTPKMQRIVSQLRKGEELPKPDQEWFLKWIGTRATYITPGIFIFATPKLKAKSKPKVTKILQGYAGAVKAFHESYIALQMHQQRALERELEWKKIYSPQQFQTAKTNLKQLVTIVKDSSVQIKAPNGAQQTVLNQIEKRIEKNKPLKPAQKGAFLADIQKGAFKLKATKPGAKAKALTGGSLLKSLQKRFAAMPELEKDLASEWEEDNNAAWAA